MSTAVTPRLPSAAEIERTLRERMPGLTVYNPSTDWLHLQVFGLDYYAPPDLAGAVEPHPVTGAPVKCDGRLLLRGRYLTQKDSSGKVIEGQDAPSMVKFLIAAENYGQLGLCWLPGSSAEEDATLISTAKKVYQNYQITKDEMIVARRTEFKANWAKGPHKGEPCPPPTPAETAAMDRLQMRRREASFKYECDIPTCETGYAVNDWDRFVSHMKAAHNITPDRKKYDGEVTGLGPATAPAEVEVASPRSAIAEAAEKMKEEQAETPSDAPVPRRKR